MRLLLCLPLILSVPLAAETLQVAPTVFYHTFSHSHPVLKRIRPGDVVQTKTLDSGGSMKRAWSAPSRPIP